MPPVSVLIAGKTAAISSDITVAAGTPVRVTAYGLSSEEIISFTVTPASGVDALVNDMVLTRGQNAIIIDGVGTYQANRPVTQEDVRIDTES